MQVIKVLPIGFCYGVQHSYQSALELIKLHSKQHIYFLGWLVHNRTVIEELQTFAHVTILDDQHTSRIDLIKQLPHTNHDILVLSAHGTATEVIKLAQAKGYQVIDLTCKYVYKTHALIQQKVAAGYHIIFIGKRDHPETSAIKELDPNMSIISDTAELKGLQFAKDIKLFCTNQTTFNYQTLLFLIAQLKTLYPQLEFNNEICQATKIRQLAVLNLDANIDLCFVVGDQCSNNANELVKIIQHHYQFPVYLINNVQDIQRQWLVNKHCCGIVSATSTPLHSIELITQFLAKI